MKKGDPKFVTISMGPVKPTGPTTVEDVIKNGHYTDHYRYLKNERIEKIFKNWPKDLPEREIFIGLIPDGEVIPKGGVKQYWLEREYEIPENSDTYLHQLMCDTPEDKMPKELKDKNLIAYTDTPSFLSESGYDCRLCVRRLDSDRLLIISFEDDDWHDSWGFVLCKINSEPQS